MPATEPESDQTAVRIDRLVEDAEVQGVVTNTEREDTLSCLEARLREGARFRAFQNCFSARGENAGQAHEEGASSPAGSGNLRSAMETSDSALTDVPTAAAATRG